MAVLTKEFCAESKAVHYAHSAMMNELTAMSIALDKLCTGEDEFANLSVAKQVQFLARDIYSELVPHFRQEEASVLRTISEVSRELANFAQQMCGEHQDLEKRFGTFCQTMEGLEAAPNLDDALREVKQEGRQLVRDLERHVNTEETELAGFL
jgi:iron-sulfur cluster repair protein YtfE (RIC family)